MMFQASFTLIYNTKHLTEQTREISNLSKMKMFVYMVNTYNIISAREDDSEIKLVYGVIYCSRMIISMSSPL